MRRIEFTRAGEWWDSIISHSCSHGKRSIVSRGDSKSRTIGFECSNCEIWFGINRRDLIYTDFELSDDVRSVLRTANGRQILARGLRNECK